MCNLNTSIWNGVEWEFPLENINFSKDHTLKLQCNHTHSVEQIDGIFLAAQPSNIVFHLHVQYLINVQRQPGAEIPKNTNDMITMSLVINEPVFSYLAALLLLSKPFIH